MNEVKIVKYQYHFELPDGDELDLMRQFSRLGQEGWSYCGEVTTRNSVSTFLVFRKTVHSQEEPER